MAIRDFDELPESQYGKLGESIIIRYMRRNGTTVLPVYERVMDDVKGGPRLFMPLYMDPPVLVAPDALCMPPTPIDTHWGEFKSKGAFTWHWVTQTWQDGIDEYLFRQYVQVEKHTPWPVLLYFYHDNPRTHPRDIARGADKICPTGLYRASLSHLRVNVDHTQQFRDKRGRVHKMVYWRIDVLTHVATAEQVLGHDDDDEAPF